jgi:hypothetical protein
MRGPLKPELKTEMPKPGGSVMVSASGTTRVGGTCKVAAGVGTAVTEADVPVGAVGELPLRGVGVGVGAAVTVGVDVGSGTVVGAGVSTTLR